MLEKIKKYIRDLPYPTIVDRKEHEYCKEFFNTWKEISAQLEEKQERLKMGLYVLQKTCDFYLAEWCGILKVDMDIGVWTPIIWYDTETGEMKETLFNEFEFADNFHEWVKALEDYTPVVFTDIEAFKESSPLEHEAYRRLEVRSVIGIPIDRNKTGFLVVKNMNRFCEDSDFLRMICSLLMIIFDYEVPETSSILQSPAPVHNRDIRINMLGKIEIITSSGTIIEDTIHQNRTWKILMYLLIRERAVKAHEMVQDLWPDEPEEKCMINIRGAIYRFRQRTAGLTDKYLIVSLPTGYSINPDYNISTDAAQLEEAVMEARETNGLKEKTEILKTSFPLYRGSVFESAQGEPWIMAVKAKYHMLYIELVNMLLDALAKSGDEEGVRQYALKSLEIEPGNPAAYYHLIGSIRNAGGSIQIYLEMAKEHLIKEEFDALYQSLSEEKDDR